MKRFRPHNLCHNAGNITGSATDVKKTQRAVGYQVQSFHGSCIDVWGWNVDITFLKRLIGVGEGFTSLNRLLNRQTWLMIFVKMQQSKLPVENVMWLYDENSTYPRNKEFAINSAKCSLNMITCDNSESFMQFDWYEMNETTVRVWITWLRSEV